MWTFGKRIAVGFALSFAVLAAVGGVGYRSVDSLARTSYAVAHSHAVLEHIASALNRLTDAETGQRGFVITGEDAYLEPYRASAAAVPRVMSELRELTADNANQQRRLAEAEPLVAAKLGELQRTIDTRRTAGFEATQKIDGGLNEEGEPWIAFGSSSPRANKRSESCFKDAPPTSRRPQAARERRFSSARSSVSSA